MGMYETRKMDIGFSERDNGRLVMVVRNARMLYRNLTGIDNTKYPNHQIKTFAIEIPENMVPQILDHGYQLSEWRSKNDPDDVRHLLNVKIQYKLRKDDKYNPRVYINASGVRTLLDVDTIDQYQDADITHVNFFASMPWGDRGTCFINQMDMYLNEEDPYAIPDIEEESSF
jgi:hypothetical protein